ncbi:hypothetical protein K040078D81_47910 [Blautia hominis]|uniref:Uncharacterized protein n=1 Tax=Blautia hominis TaxID=2025493 RepID=A0ABQ0BGV1_9FIRM
MLIDWQKIDGTWYYFNSLGHMLTGCNKRVDGNVLDEVREGVANQIVTERKRAVSNDDASIDN